MSLKNAMALYVLVSMVIGDVGCYIYSLSQVSEEMDGSSDAGTASDVIHNM